MSIINLRTSIATRSVTGTALNLLRVGATRAIAVIAVAGLGIVMLATPALAQSPLAALDIGSASGDPGDSGLGIPVVLTSTGGAQVASLNFTLVYDTTRLTLDSIVAGSAATSAGKILDWNPSNGKGVLYGGNSVIGDGTIISMSFSIKSTAPSGTADVQFVDVLVSSPSATEVPNSVSQGSIQVIPPTPTPSNTPTATNTPVPPTATNTTVPPTSGPSPTPSRTYTPTLTRTPTKTFTPGPSPTASATYTPGPSATASATVTPTMTATLGATELAATGAAKGEEQVAAKTAEEATASAVAELDAAVEQTATALAPPAPTQTQPEQILARMNSLLPGMPAWALPAVLGGLFFLFLLLLLLSLRLRAE